jgi:CRISPR/Cas system CMR-associated protein Cmr3 (group 5 of RAMP superfamily)
VEEEMRKFKSDGEFMIAGRGKVFTVLFDEDIPRKEVINQTIEIDGLVYKCLGIEQFAIYLGDPILKKNTLAGLLIQELPIQMAVDNTLPAGEAHLVNPDGKIACKIVNIKEEK